MQYLKLIVFSVALVIVAAPTLAQSDFATIEFIAAFKPGSAEEVLVREAVQNPMQQARLAQHLQSLTNNTPVQFTGFVSGGSIRFAVDTDALVRRLAERLATNNDIKVIHINDKAKLSGARYSGEAEIIASLQPGRAAVTLIPWLKKQSQCIGIPLDGEIKGHELHVWVLWKDLSISIIRQIEAHEEIDYVERNALLFPTPKRN